jgi:O-antigen/teichoic acid export membrane protein
VDERSFQNPKLSRISLVVYKTVADLAGKGALFVITVAAARTLSAHAFGLFSLGSTLGWMLAVLSDFGIQLHVARAIARRPNRAAALARAWLRIRLWTAAGATLAAIAGLGLAGWNTAAVVPIALLAVVYACSGLFEFLHYVYRGLSRSDIESSLTLWQRGGMLVCGIAALALWRDVTALAVAMLVPAAVTLAASVRIAASVARDASARAHASATARLQRSAADELSSSHEPAATWRIFRRDVWPIGAGIVLSALYFRIDVLLVQLWSGTEAVGLYNAVFRLVEALRLFPAAVMAVALPSLCRASDLRPLARAAVPATVGASAAAIVLWSAAGWLVPWIYQARYASAVPAFRILVLSFPLMTLNMALTHQLVGRDGQRAYAVLAALALAVNLALNARLVPALSIDGAAWATLGTEVFLTAGCAVALWMASTRPAGEAAVAG